MKVLGHFGLDSTVYVRCTHAPVRVPLGLFWRHVAIWHA
jgi:hypothetical protein